MEGWRRLKLMCGVSALLFAVCSARPQDLTAVAATVKEVPQRPMTLTNGYHPSSFPFNNGEPFVVDPNSGSIDFNTRSPPNAAQRTDDYYDYDSTKLEEVPFDYKGDPIDRKDVAGPGLLPRPNDIAPAKNKQTDIYQFLNLPVKYSSSDRFPLMSSSYANTKIQGSGGSSPSSPLSNHKMPSTSTQTPTSAVTTPTTTATSWYNTIKLTTTRPTPAPTRAPTTTTTPVPVPQQEEYEYDYDYPHPQEPTSHHDITTAQAAISSTTTTTTSTTTTTTKPTTVVHLTNPPLPSSPSSFITPEPSTAATTVLPSSTTTTLSTPVTSSVVNRTTGVVQVTTVRPEIDSKLDGTSFADYDDGIKPAGKPHSQEMYGQHFKPLHGNYQFGDKPYPLITNSKVPMTFTAHVSSGISLNQPKDHSSNIKPSPAPVSEEPVYSSRPLRPENIEDTVNPEETAVYENSRVTFNNGKPEPSISPELASTYSKPKPLKPNGTPDQFETVYYKVRPDTYNTQQLPSAVTNRPTNPLIQSRPYQPEPPVIKTSQDVPRKPVNTELQMSQGRPPPYPVQTDVYVKNKPQYTPPQSQPDTSKFKPPKHVINHFIKTQPNEDNKSYALQTSFSIGMDGERTDTRPAQGIGQVLMVEDGSSETVVNHTIPIKTKATTSIPLIPPPRPIQKQQPYPRPQWENVPKPPTYYPPPKRDGAIPPPQRPNLPNILPQFRPNARVDTPPTVPQSHSATIERVQIPIDHLRPPPLPKPQFLKVDRNDDNIDEEILNTPEKETRILQKTGPQPAKVTTLQMIQHGTPTKSRDDNNKENPVHIIYAANTPSKQPEKIIDDSVMLDVNDRSDIPILKTKITNIKPTKMDFPYQIVKPDENQNGSSLEYKAYSPTKLDTTKPNIDQELVPNLQDYVPIVTRDSTSNIVVSQKPITATLKTTEDNHKIVDEGHKPLLQNFQIPFHPSLKLPENSNGWSVVRKSQVDNASERIDEAGDVVGSTEKFDPDNFKPQLVGGFMPISPPSEDAKDKKTVEQSERAK
ncbi:mucin-2-like [Rhopalosiphum padi]|uniref:mucin-2-like n=1 Tax=Rhopalosiphum padi TaxID=40932 RepID=UPI00298D6E46|nr:mucin-2-like [Rhopalosiphum padi]